MMFIMVDFPEPDGPMIATYSFALTSSENAGQKRVLPGFPFGTLS